MASNKLQQMYKKSYLRLKGKDHAKESSMNQMNVRFQRDKEEKNKICTPKRIEKEKKNNFIFYNRKTIT